MSGIPLGICIMKQIRSESHLNKEGSFHCTTGCASKCQRVPGGSAVLNNEARTEAGALLSAFSLP